MKKQIAILMITVAALSGTAFCNHSLAAECQNIEGQIQTWNGWPPWIRIESRDKKSVFGIETNEKGTKSDFIPSPLLEKLYTQHSLDGTFCIKLTGKQTNVPYDDRVIKYIKVISYKVNK
jgi:hypothetical protein